MVDSSGEGTFIKKPRSRLSSDLVSPGLLRGASQKPGQSATTAQARRELSTLGAIASQELAAPGTGTAQRAQRQTTRTRTTKNSSNY
jgi:hypothetical protein